MELVPQDKKDEQVEFLAKQVLFLQKELSDTRTFFSEQVLKLHKKFEESSRDMCDSFLKVISHDPKLTERFRTEENMRKFRAMAANIHHSVAFLNINGYASKYNVSDDTD
jgi:hypothetical protein